MPEQQLDTAEKQPLEYEITGEQWLQMDEVIKKYRGVPGSLIPLLHEVQSIVGFLPPEVQKRVAHGVDITASEVNGVVTFYSLFHTEPRGKYTIRVCMGTACYAMGSRRILDKLRMELDLEVGETSSDMQLTLDIVSCPGTCGLAPAMVVDEEIFGDLDPTQAWEVIQRYQKEA